jgi:hypothetical protein
MGQFSSKNKMNRVIKAMHFNDHNTIREIILDADVEVIEQFKKRSSLHLSSDNCSIVTRRQILACYLMRYIIEQEIKDAYHLLRDVLYPFLFNFRYLDLLGVSVNHVMIVQLAKANQPKYDQLILDLVNYHIPVEKWNNVAYHLLYSTSRIDMVRQIRSLLQQQNLDLMIKCDEHSIYTFVYNKAYDSLVYLFLELSEQNILDHLNVSVMQYLSWSLSECGDITLIERHPGLRFLLDFVMGPQFPEEEKNSLWRHLNDFYQKHIDYKKGLIRHGKEVISVPEAVIDYIVYIYL